MIPESHNDFSLHRRFAGLSEMTDHTRRLRYELSYLLGRSRWDTGIVPPEVVAFVAANPPGRALDIGCGSGTNVLYLARAGWQVDGVNFSRLAVLKARARLHRERVSASIWLDDATRLEKARGEYTLVLDIGCFHNLDAEAKTAYIAALQPHLAPRFTFMLYGHCAGQPGRRASGLTGLDIATLAAHFSLARREDGQESGRGASVWLWFERRDV
jgi:SAM-dependent methyltransferase